MSPVSVPPVPEGYRLRLLRDDEEQRYDDLFHLAFDDKGRFREIQVRTLPSGFFVVEHQPSHALVASCLAFHGSSSPRHANSGQLGWLVVDPVHCQKGLGAIVSAAATNRLVQEGYTKPFLGTEDWRTPAIAIYLRLGWQPHLYTDDMRGRWDRIFAAINANKIASSQTLASQ
jgi:mycothiol synthase